MPRLPRNSPPFSVETHRSRERRMGPQIQDAEIPAVPDCYATEDRTSPPDSRTLQEPDGEPNTNQQVVVRNTHPKTTLASRKGPRPGRGRVGNPIVVRPHSKRNSGRKESSKDPPEPIIPAPSCALSNPNP
ncbi:hypothetical protein CKAH01_11046 [Colletotrichum kahawae]|uniref:Uncharacterized protein n=1 Tax=Colletotrichum kahawae TaxID=34407 RepID=A0AAD9XUW2_COLKA|nr:hypothetical protein CKAH01_11046 [Colletotrichum kahawae]